MLVLAPTATRLSFRALSSSSKTVSSVSVQQVCNIRNMSTGVPGAVLNVESNSYVTAPGVALSDHQKLIVGSVLDLFAGKPSLEKLKLWQDDGSFEDPITIANGRKEFEPQWYGLRAVFSEIKPLKQNITSSGNPISIDMSTMYKVKVIGKETTINSVVLIHIDEATGKISKVEDKWDGKLPDSSIANVSAGTLLSPGLWFHYAEGWTFYGFSFIWYTKGWEAFRRLNAVSVPKMVSVPKSDAEDAAKQ